MIIPRLMRALGSRSPLAEALAIVAVALIFAITAPQLGWLVQ